MFGLLVIIGIVLFFLGIGGFTTTWENQRKSHRNQATIIKLLEEGKGGV